MYIHQINVLPSLCIIICKINKNTEHPFDKNYNTLQPHPRKNAKNLKTCDHESIKKFTRSFFIKGCA